MTSHNLVFDLPTRFGEPSQAEVRVCQPTNPDNLREGRVTVSVQNADYTASQLRIIAGHLLSVVAVMEASR